MAGSDGDGENQTPSSLLSSNKPQLRLPWRTRLALLAISAFSDAARRSNGTINRRFLNFFDLPSPPSPSKPIHSVLSSDVTVDPTRNLWFRLYTPTDHHQHLPVFVFFHGGGFSFLSAATKAYDAVCRTFARRLPAIVVSVNYRRTPEDRFPCQYDDGFDVLRFLDDDNNNNTTRPNTVLPPNADLSKCFLAGDSAGANLAHHVAVRVCRNHRFRVLKVVGLVSIQPFFGGKERTESEIRLVGYPIVSVARTDWSWKAFLGEGGDRDHYAVNVSGPNAEDVSGLDYPETVVFVGGLDPLQDWQRRYYEWLKGNGKGVRLIEYPNMIHAFYVFPELPESSQLLQQVKDFVAARISSL